MLIFTSFRYSSKQVPRRRLRVFPLVYFGLKTDSLLGLALWQFSKCLLKLLSFFPMFIVIFFPLFVPIAKNLQIILKGLEYFRLDQKVVYFPCQILYLVVFITLFLIARFVVWITGSRKREYGSLSR